MPIATQTLIENATRPGAASSSAPRLGGPALNRRKLPHSVIVRAPGLLPMRYSPSELARELGVPARVVRGWLKRGMPHERSPQGHLWIDGRACFRWLEAERKDSTKHALGTGEAFCFGCNRPTAILDPVRRTGGKWIRLSGSCPVCGSKVNRGVRHGQP